MNDKPVDIKQVRRARIMKEHGLTEEDAVEIRQLIINNQRAWVHKLLAEGRDASEDIVWLKEHDPEYDPNDYK